MRLTPDSIVFAEWGVVKLNATLVFTFAVNALIVATSWLVTRDLSSDTSISRGQNLLEVLVDGIRGQIVEFTQDDPDRYIPFVGTLFVFIAVSNALTVVPFYEAPTASLSTTTALALCVFIAVPAFGVAEHGLAGYIKTYLQPSPLLLPFNVIGELSRTIALSIRLFGNIMSGSLIVAMLVALAPLFFPIVMQAFGLLTGIIQAYIFAALAAVFISSATRARKPAADTTTTDVEGDSTS